MSKEAMKLARELVQRFIDCDGISSSDYLDVRDALDKALAEQPAPVQQEPVAYLCENAVGHKYFRWKKPSSTYKPIALYTSPPAQQEPVDFTSLLREAEEIVQGKPTWKRFIDGTPLSNDIAVWMAVFAQDVARRITKGNT